MSPGPKHINLKCSVPFECIDILHEVSSSTLSMFLERYDTMIRSGIVSSTANHSEPSSAYSTEHFDFRWNQRTRSILHHWNDRYGKSTALSLVSRAITHAAYNMMNSTDYTS